MKTENQMLKNGKSANRNEHQSRKTGVHRQKPQTDGKSERKTENPNAPLILHTNIGMHIL